MLLFLTAITQNLSITSAAAKNPQRPVLTALIWRELTRVPTQISRECCARVIAYGHVAQQAHGKKY